MVKTKKRLMSFTIVLLLFVSLLLPSLLLAPKIPVTHADIVPTEQVVNGDFETGDLTGWSYTNDVIINNTEQYSGSYCARVGYSSTLYQDFSPAIPYSTIVSSFCYLKTIHFQGANPYSFHISILYNNSVQTSFNVYLSNNVWTYVDLASHITSGGNVAEILFGNIMDNWNYVFADNVSLIALASTTGYRYYFFGGLNEKDNTLIGATNVTACLQDGTLQTFTVDAGLTNVPVIENFPSPVYYVTWDVSSISNMYRFYYPPANVTTIYLYTVKSTDTVSAYTVFVQDFTGTVIPNSTCLTVKLIVNNAWETIERLPIPTTYLVPLILEYGRTYTRSVTLSDGSIISDTFTPTTSTSDVMIINLHGFYSSIQLPYTYINIIASRKNSTSIMLLYSDSLVETQWLNVSIYLQNGTRVYTFYTTPVVGGIENVTWNNADASLDYKVVTNVYQALFEYINQTNYLPANPTYNPPFDLSVFGTPTWLTDLIPYLIIIVVAGVFSAITIVGGMIAMLAVAGIEFEMGWLPSTIGDIITFGFVFALLFAIGRKKERGET